MSKQDRQGVRSASELERKYNYERKFAEVMGLYVEVSRNLEEQEAIMEAELSLRLGYDDNDQIVSMINASADIISLHSNRLEIESDFFSLSADGTINASAGTIGGCEMVGGMLLVPAANIDGKLEADQINAYGLAVVRGLFDTCTILDTCVIEGVLKGNTICSHTDANGCVGAIEFSSHGTGSFYRIGVTKEPFGAGMYIGAYDVEPGVNLYSEIANVYVGGDHGFDVDTISSINLNAQGGAYVNGVEIANKSDISALDERLKALENA